MGNPHTPDTSPPRPAPKPRGVRPVIDVETERGVAPEDGDARAPLDDAEEAWIEHERGEH